MNITRGRRRPSLAAENGAGINGDTRGKQPKSNNEEWKSNLKLSVVASQRRQKPSRINSCVASYQQAK